MQKKSKGLEARYNKSYETRDQGGAGQGVFDWKKAGREITFYKVREGKNRLNIIPFAVKSKHHPLVRSKDMEIGDLDYVMDYWVHKSIGPANTTDVLCLKKMFGKPCPVCEEAERFKGAGKDEEYKDLKPSRRVIYNVQDVRDPDKGLQVFDVSHYLFEHELTESQRYHSEGEELISFADLRTGRVVVCRGETAKFGGHDYFKFKDFAFIEREEELDEDLSEAALSFDDLMIVRTYEETKQILFGEDEDDEDEKLAKLKGKSKSDEDDEEEEDEKPASKSKPKEDDEDSPKSKPKAKSEDDEDEKPKSKGGGSGAKAEKATPVKGNCPHGHVFGKDCDEHDECNKCKSWDDCVKAST